MYVYSDLFFTRNTAHFEALKLMHHVFDHAASLFRSCCSFLMSFSSEMAQYSLVSSANMFAVDSTTVGRSFTKIKKIKNRMGESSAPYGTPDTIAFQLESAVQSLSSVP